MLGWPESDHSFSSTARWGHKSRDVFTLRKCRGATRGLRASFYGSGRYPNIRPGARNDTIDRRGGPWGRDGIAPPRRASPPRSVADEGTAQRLDPQPGRDGPGRPDPGGADGRPSRAAAADPQGRPVRQPREGLARRSRPTASGSPGSPPTRRTCSRSGSRRSARTTTRSSPPTRSGASASTSGPRTARSCSTCRTATATRTSTSTASTSTSGNVRDLTPSRGSRPGSTAIDPNFPDDVLRLAQRPRQASCSTSTASTSTTGELTLDTEEPRRRRRLDGRPRVQGPRRAGDHARRRDRDPRPRRRPVRLADVGRGRAGRDPRP